MNDKDLEQIQTVDVNVTPESIDAHVICFKENGYDVLKKHLPIPIIFLHLYSVPL